ncbi:MAG: hypothetical protein ACUVRS_10575 [Armatimonadota bacterium]
MSLNKKSQNNTNLALENWDGLSLSNHPASSVVGELCLYRQVARAHRRRSMPFSTGQGKF